MDRSTYDDDDVERPSNKTTRQQLGDGGDDDGFRRRKFHFIRAAQVTSPSDRTLLQVTI